MASGFDWTSGARQRLDIGGFGYEAIGFGPAPDEAPTLVLLHEGLGCLSLWRGFPRELAARTGFGVFVWSRGGYGRSDPVDLPRPLDYMTREARERLPGVLDAIGLRRGVLLGHSDGASIATIYAGTVADPRVLGLVLMAPHFFTEPEGLAAIAAARTAFEHGDLRARLARHHADVDVAFRGWCDAWLDPGFVSWNIADCLDGLRVPSLAIQGENDQYGTKRQVQEVVSRSRVPVDVAMLPACGHSPQFEQAEMTLAAVAGFCARLERRA
jgi:pimeloyl-ACP methyl ester carboxylesterase